MSSEESPRTIPAPGDRRRSSGLRSLALTDHQPVAVVAPGSMVAERFRIEALLGEGGMGEVYAAEHVDMGRRVALKLVRPELAADPSNLERFRREARAASRIKSDRVVQVYDFGKDAGTGRFYLAMEMLEGETLGALMTRVGTLSPADTVRIASQIAEALEAAHAAGVIHRDLKPENVFLENNGRLKVLDFGIARIQDTGEGGAANKMLTSVGVVVGTPAYINPEAAGRREVVPQSDLYSLGVMLFEMLVGRLPFDDAEPIVLVGLHLRAPPERVRLAAPRALIPESLDDLVDSMLEKDPADRPPSARAVIDRLAAITEELRISRVSGAGDPASGSTSLAPRTTGPVGAPAHPLGAAVHGAPTPAPTAAATTPAPATQLAATPAPALATPTPVPHGGYAAPLAPPSLPFPVTVSAGYAAQPEPRPSRGAWIALAAIGALVVAAGLAGLVVLVGMDRTPPAPTVTALDPTGALAPAVITAPPPSAATPPGAPPAAVVATPPPPTADDGETTLPTPIEPELEVSTTTTSEPTRPGRAGRHARGGGGRGEAATSEDLPQLPAAADVRARLSEAMPRVRACAGALEGTAVANLTIHGNGTVASVEITGAPFAGTRAASCMATVLRSVTFPRFRQPTFTVRYPIAVRGLAATSAPTPPATTAPPPPPPAERGLAGRLRPVGPR